VLDWRRAELAGTRFFGALLGLLAMAGCAGGVRAVVHEPEGPLSVAALVVTPPRLLGTEPAGWRAFELGQRQVDVALRQAGERLAVFGPGEVRVSRWEEPGWLGNTAVPVLVREGVAAEQALLLRTVIERRDASSSQEREDQQGLAKGGVASAETQWLVSVELLHPSSRRVLGEFSGAVTIDPFAAPTGEEDFDPAPPMTRLLEQLTKEALRVARRWERAGPTARDSGLTLALSPAIVAVQPDAARAQPDALQAEVWIQARARFLQPWLPEGEVVKLARTPPALLVVAAPGDAPVQPGDLIIEVDGRPPLPEVLARRRLLGAVPVRVGRGGVEREALLP
jgi:hypothetical protein